MFSSRLLPGRGLDLIASSAQAAQRPNIVLILADDLGWKDVGYHNSGIRTPHLDRLAAEGTRLDWHYVYPTCSPTRVALLSRRFPSRFGVLGPLGSTTKTAVVVRQATPKT